MKRLLSALAALFICLLLLPLPAGAVARADLRLNIVPVQGENDQLILEVDLTVANGSPDQFISNVELVYDNHTIASQPEIYGSSDLFLRTQPLGISYSTTYNDFPITLYYIDFDGAAMENTYYVAVGGQYAEPELSFTRTASAMDEQGKIQLSYTLRNDGDMPLANLRISDSAVSGDEVATLDYLEVGHSKTFTQSLTVTKTVESKPQVSYTVSGGSARVYQLSLEPLTLTPSNPKLALTLKSDLNSILSSDRATLTLNISNEGNIPFTSVTISDESLGKIAEGISMEVGKVNTYTKIVNPTKTTSYRFTAVATDASGKSYSFSSDPLTIEVLPAESPAPAGQLELEVTAGQTSLDAPGEVSFSMVVRNTGQDSMEQLTISDGRGNVLTRTSTLEPGVQVFNISISVDETTSFTFLAEALQPDGQPVQAASAPLEILVNAPQLTDTPQSLSPEPSSIPVNSGTTGFSPWLLVLFIFLILLIIACIVVLVILQVRSRRRRQAEEAEDFITSTVYTTPDFSPPDSHGYVEPDEDARAEISRFASQYSPRKADPAPPRPAVPEPQEAEEDDEPTVYKARAQQPRREPRTRQDYRPKG